MSSETGNGTFPQTRWTLIVRARDPFSEECREALDQLIQSYWRPVYTYIRRMGIRMETAGDLTQEYFATFLKDRTIERFDRERGKFKSFILITLKHQLSKLREREGALKRGGRSHFLNKDIKAIEERLAGNVESPEAAFRRNWAESVLNRALAQLEEECRARGRGDYFRVLASFFSGEGDVSYRALASRFDLTEDQVRTALRRTRPRLHEILVSIVREYVVEEAEVEGELSDLLRSLREVNR